MTGTTRRALVGDARCLQCGRVIARAREYPGGIHLTVAHPAYDPEVVQRLRCPVCRGNLRIEDTEHEVVFRRKLTPDELAPKRGRKPREVRA